MKIEISEETFQFLKELASEMKSQNNRSTASPYFYSIYEDRVHYQPAVNFMVGVDSDEEIENDDELVLVLDHVDSFETIQSLREYLDLPSDTSLEDMCEKYDIEVWQREIKREPAYNYNCFLTEKACERHIKSNDHHYNNPVSYVHHAWRNPEMKKLMESLSEIVEKNSEEPLF